jgi:uncharacterized protein
MNMIEADHSRRHDPANDVADTIALLDWRRRVTELYASVRANPEPHVAWLDWRQTRDDLFKQHAQTPLGPDDRRDFTALPFFEYDPSLRMQVGLSSFTAPEIKINLGVRETISIRPFARTIGLKKKFGGELAVFSIAGYGGGVFLPFADATNSRETYGSGRYLLDTVKGADLGSSEAGELILDFNFAYNPSCSYSSRYVCPLAPPVNRLPGAVRGGEMAMRL